MQLATVAEQLKGELHGPDSRFNSVVIDTRSMCSGDLYIAIQGQNFDGNDFVKEASGNGASGAIVHNLVDVALPQLLVKDTTVSLGKLAQINRRRSAATIAGITGSQGKTTVKEMVGQILTLAGDTLVTRGNLNNAIGVPLTLLEIEARHNFGVIEMGANHADEIAYSAALVEPDIAVITNAAPAHLEGFGSLEGVARAKGEIIDSLGSGGIMVLNADDRFFEMWKHRAREKKTVSFSVQSQDTDYYATEVNRLESGGVTFELNVSGESKQVSLSLLGKHNVSNAVAATAVAMEAGASFDQVVEGLANIASVKGRLFPFLGFNHGSVIDDSYNASPGSFRAAIDVLAEYRGRRILLMGDMAELGSDTDAAHKALGEYARESGIEELWTVGDCSEVSAKSFGAGATHFGSRAEMIKKCKEVMGPDVALLIKGSRDAAMNEVVESLIDL
ncbi:MAG: UDP-N-acetylmuramoyl-tripeptide--D-alanyl-D-alanine ligase [Gammaproteobacteria bacterium]|nr:UDP-N-acetylmuramoyl-tripeptide--D-alanyl-D-alanine ligase [Gammaproteobacteria bacterium]